MPPPREHDSWLFGSIESLRRFYLFYLFFLGFLSLFELAFGVCKFSSCLMRTFCCLQIAYWVDYTVWPDFVQQEEEKNQCEDDRTCGTYAIWFILLDCPAQQATNNGHRCVNISKTFFNVDQFCSIISASMANSESFVALFG